MSKWLPRALRVRIAVWLASDDIPLMVNVRTAPRRDDGWRRPTPPVRPDLELAR